MTPAGGPHEALHLMRPPRVHVGPSGQKLARNAGVALVAGPHERRPLADVRGVDGGAAVVGQLASHVLVSDAGGVVQRGALVVVLGGGVRAVRQQEGDELHPAVLGGEHERRSAIL